MQYPHLNKLPAERVVLRRFGGLDRRPETPAGCWRDMQNLTGDDAPRLRVRPQRGVYDGAGQGAALAALGGQTPVWLWTTGELGANGHRWQLLPTPVDTTIERRLARLGTLVFLWPDKRWADAGQLAAGLPMLEGVNCGDLEQQNELTAAADPGAVVTLLLCDDEGVPIDDLHVGTQPPESGRWLDSSCTPPVLRGYSAALGAWIEDTALSLRVQAQGIGHLLRAGDGVELQFAPPQTADPHGAGNLPLSPAMQSAVRALNDRRVLREVSENELALDGSFLPEQGASLSFALTRGVGLEVPHLRVRRSVPALDFVVSCQNRLWGCRRSGGVNAIYASKRGDGRNWNVFAGTADDSYAAERGEDGPFTGAAVLGSNPLFFRERSVEKVFPSASGAHQILTQALEGVGPGCHASCAVLDDALYYQSRDGVCRYGGTMPERIGAALGERRLHGGVGAFCGRKYYLSVLDETDAPELLVYDTERHFWHREDGTRFRLAVTLPEGLVFSDAAGLWRIGGERSREGVHWYAETGRLLGAAGRRTLVRLRLRCRVGLGASARLCLREDETRPWRELAALPPGGEQDLTLCCRPLQAERLRLRLEGCGDFTLEALELQTAGRRQ